MFIERDTLWIDVGSWRYFIDCFSKDGEEQKIEDPLCLEGLAEELGGKKISRVEETYAPMSGEEGANRYRAIFHFEDGTKQIVSWKLDHDWRVHKGHIKIFGQYSKRY